MKKHRLIIYLTILLVLSIALNCYFLLKPDEPLLYVRIGRPLDFDEAGKITSEYQNSLEDRELTEIILLSMINAQPIPEEEYPNTQPEGRIWLSYNGTGYPYELWFYEDYIIFGNDSNVFRKIQNDHNEPVQIIKDLVNSISTTVPG